VKVKKPKFAQSLLHSLRRHRRAAAGAIAKFQASKQFGHLALVFLPRSLKPNAGHCTQDPRLIKSGKSLSRATYTTRNCKFMFVSIVNTPENPAGLVHHFDCRARVGRCVGLQVRLPQRVVYTSHLHVLGSPEHELHSLKLLAAGYLLVCEIANFSEERLPLLCRNERSDVFWLQTQFFFRGPIEYDAHPTCLRVDCDASASIDYHAFASVE